MQRTKDNLIHLPKDATKSCVFAYSWANQILIPCDAMSLDQSMLPVQYEDLLSQSTTRGPMVL